MCSNCFCLYQIWQVVMSVMSHGYNHVKLYGIHFYSFWSTIGHEKRIIFNSLLVIYQYFNQKTHNKIIWTSQYDLIVFVTCKISITITLCTSKNNNNNEVQNISCCCNLPTNQVY